MGHNDGSDGLQPWCILLWLSPVRSQLPSKCCNLFIQALNGAQYSYCQCHLLILSIYDHVVWFVLW